MLIYFILIVLPMLANCQDKCAPLLAEADKCFRKVLYIGDPSIKLVKNDADLKAHCGEYRASEDCIMKWGRCLTGGKALIFDYLKSGIQKVRQDRCNIAAGKKAFIDAVSCLDAGKAAKVAFCTDSIVHVLNSVKNVNIKGWCCYLSYLIDCVKTFGKTECGAKGGQVSAYVEKTATNLLGLIGSKVCSDVSNYGKCKTGQAAIVKEIDALIKDKSKVPKAATSPLLAFVNMLKKFVKP